MGGPQVVWPARRAVAAAAWLQRLAAVNLAGTDRRKPRVPSDNARASGLTVGPAIRAFLRGVAAEGDLAFVSLAVSPGAPPQQVWRQHRDARAFARYLRFAGCSHSYRTNSTSR